MYLLLYIYPHLQGCFVEADDYQFHGVFHMQEKTPGEMSGVGGEGCGQKM